MTENRIDTASLQPLIHPRSIAVIGASATPGKIGAVPMQQMAAYGYDGKLYPVNPRGGEILGWPVYPEIAAVPGDVDMAIIAIPASKVLAVLEDCVRKGVKTAVIFSSGFAEVGGSGITEQAKISAIARESGMRILGPNGLGVTNISAAVFATFSPLFLPRLAPDGCIGLVSQSGAFGGYVANLAAQRGVSFSTWITTGNEADIDLPDAIALQSQDPATRVILVYMEGARNGPKLLTALGMARAAGKPVIILKVGRTAAGAEAAASHTAALAGADDIYDAVFRQAGAFRAQSVGEWFGLGYAYAVGKPPAGREIGLITISGGVGVMMADEACRNGLEPTPLSAAAQAGLKELVPFAGTRNPVDVTGQMVADLSAFERMVEIVAEDQRFATLISFNAGIGRNEERGFEIQRAWANIRTRYPDIHIAISGAMTPAVRAAYEEVGCLTYAEPDLAVRIAAAMAQCERRRNEPPAAVPAPGVRQELPPGTLNEVHSVQVLRAAGIPVVNARLATVRDEALAAAREIGFPVVVKIVAADILHKSDIGAVVLNVTDEVGVAAAWERCMDAARQHMPQADVDGVLVAPMVAGGGVETILGVHRDPVFGPVVMFGLGGVLVEVLHEVAFRVAPFGLDEAHAMVKETRAADILVGVRGAPPADVAVLAQALSDLSRFAAAHQDVVESVDVNPFVVREKGQGGMALDAVIRCRD